MNLLFLVLWVFALPFPRLRPMASNISAVWACVMVVCKMFYQLKVIKPLDYSSNCTAVSEHTSLPYSRHTVGLVTQSSCIHRYESR